MPQLELDGVLAATFCPRDGHMSPEAVVQGYAAAAVARGARVVQGCPATGDRARGRPHHRRAHRARDDRHRHRRVRRRAPGRARSARWPASRSPCTASRATCGSRPRTAGCATTSRSRSTSARASTSTARAPASSSAGARRRSRTSPSTRCARLPLIVELPIQSSWWGYYEVSPDHNAIVGESSEPGRFLYATGFSGHGFQQSPAVGEHLAQLIRGEPPAFDLERLRARALRARRAARRALRRLTAPRASRKTNDRATAVSSTPPTYRFPERNLYLGGASTYFGDARCETEAYVIAARRRKRTVVKEKRNERKTCSVGATGTSCRPTGHPLAAASVATRRCIGRASVGWRRGPRRPVRLR